jgi:hypothetical protein
MGMMQMMLGTKGGTVAPTPSTLVAGEDGEDTNISDAFNGFSLGLQPEGYTDIGSLTPQTVQPLNVLVKHLSSSQGYGTSMLVLPDAGTTTANKTVTVNGSPSTATYSLTSGGYKFFSVSPPISFVGTVSYSVLLSE